MKTRFYRSIATCLALAMTSVPAQADAEQPPHSSYTRTSSDGEYILVMLLPVTEDPSRWNEAKAQEIQRIRAAYSQSGLYRNDGSKDPLWTVDWHPHEYVVPRDGIHLIRIGRWASSGNHEVLGFLTNGKLVRAYTVKELMDFPWLLPQSDSRVEWYSAGSVDEENAQFHLWTEHGEQLVFDLRTGDILPGTHPPRWICGGVFMGLGLLVAVVLVFRHRRSRRPRTTA